jgi:hypothetical protein
MMNRQSLVTLIAAALVAGGIAPAQAQQAAQEPDVTALAKTTQNPVGDLVSIPFQFNFNAGGDLGGATFFNLNLQPVIPFKLTADWNMILRPVIPIVSVPGQNGLSYSGFGDTQVQMYISPSKPGKLIWGLGPVLSLPTATAAPVQTGTFGAGVGAVALTMSGPWVIGGLVGQYWPVVDGGGPPETNLFVTQPFVNYNFGKGWAIAFAPLITANWDASSGNQWTVPLGLGITRTTVFNGRPMSIGAQYYNNVTRPDGAAGYTFRFIIAPLFPKR